MNVSVFRTAKTHPLQSNGLLRAVLVVGEHYSGKGEGGLGFQRGGRRSGKVVGPGREGGREGCAR